MQSGPVGRLAHTSSAIQHKGAPVMTMATSLMDFILSLLRDDHAKAAFAADPEQALHDAGLSEVCSEDVADAISYVAEYHPVSFVGNREYNVGNSNVSQHASSSTGHDPDFHATAVHQLEYVTNNYSYVDSHDSLIDKSVNQNIWNEGILTQSFDDHSVTATDHSVAAGDDITDSNVVTGDHNITGDGNSVGTTTDSYNTTNTDDHSIADSFNGNNIADQGSVAGNGNDGNVTNPDHSDVATNGGTVDQSTIDSHDTTTTDSHDTTTTDSHDTTTTDSNNTDSHDFSHNDDSAITHTDQDGLLNVNLSPAVNVPIEHNDVDVLHLVES
jgi:hypothetical protein